MNFVKKTVVATALAAAALVAFSPVAGAATTSTAQSGSEGLVGGLLGGGGYGDLLSEDGLVGGLLNGLL
ncbi:hypothetical protein DMH01_36295 [Amycolatopsis sp. WAC 04182]|nr:hypothetical protein DMH01_36295 [Amycolatopsis sp. WAC 04182]